MGRILMSFGSGDPRIPGIRRSVQLPSRRIEADVDDEIAFHLESRVRALVADGHPENDARRIAETEFGDLGASRRELAAVDRHRRRRERIAHWVETIAQDVRHAMRSLRRSPAFAITALVTLVIGIGSATAIFAVVNGVLLRPLPYKNPDRLVGAWFDFPPLGMTHQPQMATTYFTYRTSARTLDGIGVYKESAVNVDDGGTSALPPRRVTSALFSADLFTVLGVSPIRGRLFGESDDRPSAAPVMLISEGMWRAQFGGDPSIVGRRLDVNGVRREVIGVMPSRFRFPSAETELWIPLALDPANPPSDAFAYVSVARLRSGAKITDARRELAALLPRVTESFPNFVTGITTRTIMDQAKPTPVLVPLRDDITGGIASALWMVAGVAALLLVVACVNVANLTLVRVDARRRELAVRAALGAGRSRVMRYYFSESATLAGAAGLAGLALAWAVVRALVAAGPADIPRLGELGIDWRAASFALVISALSAIACSAIPMLRVTNDVTALRESRGGTAGRAQQRIRSALVAAQIALCLVVLAGSALLLRSFERLRAVRPGFDAAHVAAFWMSLPRAGRDTALARFYPNLIDQVAQLPGVESVGATSRLPLSTRGMNPNPLYPEDAPQWGTKLPPLQIFTIISGDYFRAMKIPLLAGKQFDRTGTQRDGDAIVSSRTAKFFWNDSTGRAALGKRFRKLPTGRWYTVVGVVGDVHDTTLAAPPSPTVYFPEIIQVDTLARLTVRTMALVVRTSGDPSAIVPAVERAVRDLVPTLPTFDVRPMTAALGASTTRLAFITLVLAGAASVTLILGAVGLYGVIAYVVTLRRRELGIRIALGATPGGIVATTAGRGLLLTGIGLAAGLVLFTVSVRFVRTFLFEVTPWDAKALGGAALLLLGVAGVASWMPARRAGRVDPAEALRAE